MNTKKIAIVHDWLTGGGAELVVEALHQMYPEAPIYTSCVTKEWQKRLDSKVVTGYLQRWPFFKIRKFIPFLRIWWFQSLDFSDYDLVISSSGAEAKGIKTSGKTLHINYCHAPTHYYWSRYNEYLQNPGFGFLNPLARFGLKILVSPLRKWDYKAAQRPDKIIANSTYTKNQIKKYYDRESTVIFPPVDTKYFEPTKPIKRNGFIITGRQTPYKRFDLAVKACTQLNLPLTVVGDGPEYYKLKSTAGPSVTFLGFVARDEIRKNLQSAEAFIFPGIDDFGIAPVEALSAGCPVIAYNNGGALDYVVPNKTGCFFNKSTVGSLVKTLDTFNSSDFSSSQISRFADKFNPQEFKTKLNHEVEKLND
jgi:glycosyltransferase involved in cell wall biosynthesis